ncbi:MAG: tetratricopeptide repeat protein [Desulfobacteraceae bacterium]|jgi:tetratricopeptide (TPR) repeat protein
MLNQKNSPSYSLYCTAFALLFLLVFLVYSNTFRASWHLDDYHSIVQKTTLRINDLQPRTIFQTFFSTSEEDLVLKKKLYRPLACLSFALNWYAGKDNVFGYHLVNICIHFLTAFMLFLTILNLFRSPRLKTSYRGNEYFIALFSAVLWSVNPLQTQAVTYIVQRMASMAAMFYLLGIYLYVKGRLHQAHFKRIVYLGGSLLSYALALACKENAAIFPLALVLVEIIFFQDLSRPKVRKTILGITLAGGVLLLLFGIFVFLHDGPLKILNTYETRLFTPLQRLLTEPRILIFYLSQLFYPVPTRLSIEHHVPVSTSLFSPWSTLPSILVVMALIGFGIAQMRKRPILSFAILFFFLNHLIESTVIGLELIFEHRNYLPSLFLFFPVSVALKALIDHYRYRKPAMHFILVSFLILIIVGLGMGTYIRNQAWATERSLWEDAIRKAPKMTRPYHNLAWGYYERQGMLDEAMKLYQKALNLLKHNTVGRSLVYNNMANLHYREGNFSKACEFWEMALKLNPNNGAFEYRLAMGLTKTGDLKKALVYVNRVHQKYPGHRNSLYQKGVILLKLKKTHEALVYFRKALKLNPNDANTLANIGISCRLLGYYDRAELFLKAALARNSQEMMVLLWLIETNLMLEDRNDADRYVQQLFDLGKFNLLTANLVQLSEDNLMSLTSRKRLIHEIGKHQQKDFETITRLENR